MTRHEAIAALKQRLAKAESERDAWRASGRQENYLEAYSMVEALQIQLDQMERAPPASNECSPPSELATASLPLLIHYSGGSYYYRGYRYDRLTDAANYARLDIGRQPEDMPSMLPAPHEAACEPTDAEQELMRTLSITYRDGVFHLRDYRYDRLADAVEYAKLKTAL